MKNLRKSAFTLAVLMLLASAVLAADDASALQPPPGVKVAIVMFEDLQCPDCANAWPVVWEAAKAHHIPVVLHDFPLYKHAWARPVAVYARFFDTRSPELGNEFRDFVYVNQKQINKDNLDEWVGKFAAQHDIPLPPNVDPDGKLLATVEADFSLGQRLGVEHTPTIYVVSQGGASKPFIEVVDRAQLNQIIEDMQKKAGGKPAAPARKPANNPANKTDR